MNAQDYADRWNQLLEYGRSVPAADMREADRHRNGQVVAWDWSRGMWGAIPREMAPTGTGGVLFSKDWDESKHQRGQPENAGQFAPKGEDGGTPPTVEHSPLSMSGHIGAKWSLKGPADNPEAFLFGPDGKEHYRNGVTFFPALATAAGDNWQEMFRDIQEDFPEYDKETRMEYADQLRKNVSESGEALSQRIKAGLKERWGEHATDEDFEKIDGAIGAVEDLLFDELPSLYDADEEDLENLTGWLANELETKVSDLNAAVSDAEWAMEQRYDEQQEAWETAAEEAAESVQEGDGDPENLNKELAATGSPYRVYYDPDEDLWVKGYGEDIDDWPGKAETPVAFSRWREPLRYAIPDVADLIEKLKRGQIRDQGTVSGLLAALDQRPELRREVSGADLNWLRAQQSQQYDADGGRSLAEMYAGHWNLLLERGRRLTQDQLEAAAAELGGGGWLVGWDHDAGRWGAFPAEVERYARGEPDRYAAERSPKGGVTVAGKFYRGGQWIPGSQMAKADTATKEKIQQANAEHKAKRLARGKVDMEKLKSKTDPHSHHELSDAEMRSAKAALRGIQDHHGEAAVHRLEELAGELHDALQETPEDEEGLREQYGKRLRAIGHMIEWAKQERESVKKETAPQKEKPGKSLYAVILSKGGIDFSKLGSDWNISEDFKQSGLTGINRKKGGMGLDEMADALAAEGHIVVPEGVNADDYLMDQLHQKARTLHGSYDAQFEADQKAYYKELEDAKRHADESEIAAVVRSGEEAGRDEGETGPLGEGPGELADEEGAGEVGDFEFGAAAPLTPDQKALRERLRHLDDVQGQVQTYRSKNPQAVVDAAAKLYPDAKTIDMGQRFQELMKEEAGKAGAKWSVVDAAMQTGPEGKDWGRLQMLVSRASGKLKEEINGTSDKVILHNSEPLHQWGISRPVDDLDIRGDRKESAIVVGGPDFAAPYGVRPYEYEEPAPEAARAPGVSEEPHEQPPGEEKPAAQEQPQAKPRMSDIAKQPRHVNHDEHAAKILQAFDAVGSQHNYATLADVRERSGLSRAEFDRAAVGLAQDGKISFGDEEGRGGIDPKVQEAGIPGIGGSDKAATRMHRKIGAKEGEPGFTGTDSLGRKWVDGKLVGKQEEVSDAGKQTAAEQQGELGGSEPGSGLGRPQLGGTASGGAGGPARAARQSRIILDREQHTGAADLSRVPEHLRQHLNEAQQFGVAKSLEAMDKYGGFLLADGTGVGKTRQLLSVADYYARQGKKVVIVAPAEVIKPDWKKGTAGGSYAKDGEAMGVNPTLSKGDAGLSSGKVHLTTYNELGKLDPHVDSDTVVLFDESHALKNTSSQRGKTGRGIGMKAGAVLYATATPADKPLHIGHLLRAGVFGQVDPSSRKAWGKAADTYRKLGLREETVRNPYTGQDIVKWSVPKGKHLEVAKRLKGLFDRMTKDGLMVQRSLSMDNVDADADHIQLTPEAQRDAEAAYQRAGGDEKRAQALMAMRRAVEPHKIPAAVEHVKRELAAGRAPIIFLGRVNDNLGDDDDDDAGGQVDENTARMLKEALVKAGIPESDIGELHGAATKTADAKRRAMDQFNSGKRKVLISTIQSGGTGVNLDDTKGDRPRSIVMMTPPLSANDMIQAAGRINRLSTKSDAKIISLVSDHPVDQWNMALLGKKMKNLGATLGKNVEGLLGQAEEDGGDDFDWGESLIRQPRSEQQQAPKPTSQIDSGGVPTRKVNTRNGERHVISWSPSQAFWNARRAGKLPSSVGVGKNPKTGQWEATIWGTSPEHARKVHADLARLGLSPEKFERRDQPTDSHTTSRPIVERIDPGKFERATQWLAGELGEPDRYEKPPEPSRKVRTIERDANGYITRVVDEILREMA